MNRFRNGDIVQHFKRTMLTEQELKDNPTAYLYEIIGYGKRTETKEEYVVYKTLYTFRDVHCGEIYMRPKEMFESLVDMEKYPNAKQKYRFEEILSCTAEKQKINENFKELMKDDSGKMILSFLFASMFMSKEELEKLSEPKNKDKIDR